MHGVSRKGHLESRSIKSLMTLSMKLSNRTSWLFVGSGYLAWEGLICLQEIGKCTEEHQAIVRKWLEEHKLEEVRTSELFDIWWD